MIVARLNGDFICGIDSLIGIVIRLIHYRRYGYRIDI